ncbi:RecQ family ATP-dependent DNA helicase [Virgibacillus flavescens]|uniref:RecQ family ATP-dependent DNA helicase n=1 Tax=Virgibacillus flavescens TaxID=1611422 RepID=UPI003D330D87
MNSRINTDLSLEESLNHYFGFTEFKSGQKEIIRDVLAGRDVLGILPTGMGKSLCYQLPAKLLPGTTIVVSPLISLMIDQVKQLKASNFKEVVALNSFMDPIERKKVYQRLQSYKLIYVSPELLQHDELLDYLKQIQISLFVVDEAHCISQWGHDFRPDYLRLSDKLVEFNNPPLLALSATAPFEVQQDIKKVLHRPNMINHIFPMDRENIIFSVKKVENEQDKNEMINQLFNRIRIPTIIYFSSRMATEQLTSFLLRKHPMLRVAFYHGGMDTIDRIQVQQQFMNNQLDVICCTSAFGMGINKKDIRLIIHYHFPLQLESFIQEVGRAGRDGKKSVSLLLYTDYDHLLPAKLMKNELPKEQELIYAFNQLYILYKQNKKLPYDQAERERIFNLTEIQWKFLHYQFENHGIIKGNQIIFQEDGWRNSLTDIKRFIEDRLLTKEKKLGEMISWIATENCLREKLYQGFQANYTVPVHDCCSNCGFTIENWELQPNTIPNSPATWETKLQALFNTGDNNA